MRAPHENERAAWELAASKRHRRPNPYFLVCQFISVVTGAAFRVSRKWRESLRRELGNVDQLIISCLAPSALPSLIFRWRRLMSEGGKEAVHTGEDVVPRDRAACKVG